MIRSGIDFVKEGSQGELYEIDDSSEVFEEDEPLDEFSGVASLGGGPMLRLGDEPPSFGRKRKTPEKAAGDAFGRAVPLGDIGLKQIKKKK